MLGLDGVEDGHARPMTAQFEKDPSPIWFFASTDNELVKSLPRGVRANRDLRLQRPRPVRDAARQAQSRQRSRNIDRFWNRYVAAWLEGGKNDPKLALLRLDAGHAEIWLDESSLLAGIKLLLGADPKEEYKDKVAEVGLR